MTPSRPYPPKPAEVYFFGTCLLDTIYPQAGLAAVELIEREGVRVIFPQGQTCCGQPAFNSGFLREAREVARAQLALFAKPIPIVVPSGSCGAMLRVHYPRLFDPADRLEADGSVARATLEAEAGMARDLGARVLEWSEFMAHVLKARLADRGPPCRATYHPSCHLLRELGVTDAPQRLLGQLRHVELVPLPAAEQCCGFGGTFSIKHGAISAAMAADKCAAARESGAAVLVSGDAGCLMNIEGTLNKLRGRAGALGEARPPLRAVPLAQFLKERVDGT